MKMVKPPWHYYKTYKGLCYQDYGAGKVLFFIHGFPLDQGLWKEQMIYFSKKYRVISMDLPGLGSSKKNLGTNFILADHADAILELLDFLRISKIICISHSMGGYVALEFCKKYKDRIEMLILCDSKAEEDTAEKKKKRIKFIAQVRRNQTRGFVSDQLNSLSLYKKGERREIREIILKNKRGNICQVLNALALRPSYWDVLMSLHAPVKLIAGEHDYMINDMKKMHGRLPSSSLSIMKQAGHVPFLDQPKEFQKILNKLLNET